MNKINKLYYDLKFKIKAFFLIYVYQLCPRFQLLDFLSRHNFIFFTIPTFIKYIYYENNIYLLFVKNQKRYG